MEIYPQATPVSSQVRFGEVRDIAKEKLVFTNWYQPSHAGGIIYL